MRGTASLATIAAAIALATACGVSAQPFPPGLPVPPEMRAHREAAEAQRQEDLRTVLRLSPDQQAALGAFLQATEPPRAVEGLDAHRIAPTRALSTPQRLDEMARREAQRAGERQRHAEALRNFYAALSPDQRLVFDALMRLQVPPPAGGPQGQGARNGPPPGPWEGPPPGF